MRCFLSLRLLKTQNRPFRYKGWKERAFGLGNRFSAGFLFVLILHIYLISIFNYLQSVFYPSQRSQVPTRRLRRDGRFTGLAVPLV